MRWTAFFLVLLICSCTPYVPLLESGREQTVVATGHFTSVQEAQNRPGKLTDEERELSQVSDCFCGKPAVAAFEVDDVLSGRTHRSRILLFNVGYVYNRDVRPGASHPQLVVMSTDGHHYIVDSLYPLDLARTTSGEWALPIIYPDEMPGGLPDDAITLVKPLQFANPLPRLPLDSDAGRRIAAGHAMEGTRVEGSFVYLGRGILIEELRQLLRK
jgi:hypothetical protein